MYSSATNFKAENNRSGDPLRTVHPVHVITRSPHRSTIVLRQDGHDYDWIFAPLGFVNRYGVGKDDLSIIINRNLLLLLP